MHGTNLIVKFEAEIIELIKAYPDTKFEREGNIIFNDINKPLDADIIKNKQVLAIFNFKSKKEEISPQVFLEAPNPSIYDFKYYIVSNSTFHKVMNRYSGEIKDFNNTPELIGHIMKVPDDLSLIRLKEEIANTIFLVVNSFLKDFKIKSHSLYKLKHNIEKFFLLNRILQYIKYNRHGQFFHFASNTNDLSNFENSFFQLLVKEVAPGGLIYRYTNLESLFSTIQNKSLRLNGIAGMNDISEVGYVERYLDPDDIPMKNKIVVHRVNDKFIYSGSTLREDLMHWRLYGDDSRGVCLTFRATKSSKLVGIQLRKVNYGIERNGENYHPELELISKIISAVKEINKQSIQFRTLNFWKHFFKSFEYKVEQEVRLLIALRGTVIKGEHLDGETEHIINKSWSLTNSHKILTPFINVEINDTALPFELTEITLGNKCPESNTNIRQFEEFLSVNGLNDVIVNQSRIDNYR